MKLLKEQPEKAAEVYWQEQDAAGRSVPVSVLDKTLRRMRWEPDITPEIEKYLADQAQDLLKGAEKGGSTPSRTLTRLSIKSCCKRPRSGSKVCFPPEHATCADLLC